MSAGILVLNQPGVYLVDADGNNITVTDGLAIGSAEALIIAGKDGANARFVRVAADGTVRIDPTGTTTQPVSVASLPLPAGAATAALQTQPGVDIGDVTINNAAGASAVNIQDGGNSITVDGPLTDAQLRASAVPISAASLPLPTGAATSALQTQPGVDIGDVTVNNAAGAAAVNIQDGGNSITVDGTISISGTVPVSGPLTNAELRATPVPISAAALPLPTGAATSALQTQPGVDIGDVTVNNGPAGAAVNIQDGGNSITVDASSWPLPTGAATETTVATLLLNSTFNSRINTLGQKVMASSTPVVISSDQSTLPVSVASLPLPAGAATAALQTQPGVDIGDVTVNNAGGASAVNIQDGGNSITVDATSWPLPTGAATEATLATLTAKDFATQTTLAALLAAFNAEDFATQTTLAALLTAFNAEDFATQTTLAALLAAFNAEDFATQTTLAALLAAFNAEDFATQTTLATRLADATFTSRINTLGQKAMASSTPIVIASDQSEVASKNALGSQVDGHSVSIGATTDADTANTVIGRLKQIITKLAAGLPAALVAGRLDTNTGSWLGSTAPTVGQKTTANSVPVTMASNQPSIPVTFTPADSRTGVSGAFLTLGGGTANTLVLLYATTYTEPAAAAQRSIASASANDTAAGTGARTVQITYYDNSGNGPLFETVTLNGTTAVNTVATDIRFIESMEVITAGSLSANAGILTLYGATGGGGGTVGSIGVGTIVTGVGDNRTIWAHHYVAAGYTAQLATFSISIQSGGGNTSGRFLIRMTQPLVANSADVPIGDVVLVNGSYLRQFQYPLEEPGFARLTAYCIPAVNNCTIAASFDWSETPT